MRTTKMVYWQEGECWLGYLEEFPDYWTQGETVEDLEEHLRDLHADLTRVWRVDADLVMADGR